MLIGCGELLDLASCSDAVYEWLLHNSLALNPDKSEVAMFGTAQRVSKLKQSASVAVAGVQVALYDHVKSLGVTFDSHLSFDTTYQQHLSRMLFPHPWIATRSAMSTDTAKIVASAIVSSRLDYCNALLAGMSESYLDKLQRVHNTLASVVTGLCRRDHSCV